MKQIYSEVWSGSGEMMPLMNSYFSASIMSLAVRFSKPARSISV